MTRLPRYGYSHPYRDKQKAEENARILTDAHRQYGWSYHVLDFGRSPERTWVVMREVHWAEKGA